MANKEIHELITAEELSASDVIAEQRENSGTWLTRKLTFNSLGLFLNKVLDYASELHTTSKTIIGAINELAQGSGQSLDTLNDVNIDDQTLADGQGIVYDATAQKWKNGAVSGGGHTYSTTEQVVGTWIDGSPVYEKTVHIQPSGDTADYTNAESITDIDVTTEVIFVAKRQDLGAGATWYYTGNGSTYPESLNYSQYKLGVRVSNGYLQYYVAGYGAQITDIWATIRYTKSST